MIIDEVDSGLVLTWPFSSMKLISIDAEHIVVDLYWESKLQSNRMYFNCN